MSAGLFSTNIAKFITEDTIVVPVVKSGNKKRYWSVQATEIAALPHVNLSYFNIEVDK